MNDSKHIAIICDGNRTWARLLNKNPYFGHTQGAKNIKNIVKAAIKNNISYLTLFLLSTENLINRSKEELDHLFSLFSKLIDYKSLFIENKIKFETVGDISKLPQNIIESIIELKEITKNFNQLNLTFAVNYGGRDEIKRAANKYKNSNNLDFENCLDSSFLPDIDIMMSDKLPTIQQVKERYEIPFDNYAILIFHPETTNLITIHEQIKLISSSLIKSQLNYVVIMPNNDYGSNIIIDEYDVTFKNNNSFKVFPSLRFEYFLTLLKNAKFVIGNSSVGIREAEIMVFQSLI